MGQLFDRISRIIRAERNHRQRETYTSSFRDGTAFAAGGAASGAAIGKIGILANGAGFSVGAVPLSAAGALTGLALYEAIRAVVEGDTSSVGAAGAGAATGAGVSAAIGGVGVGVGGTAIGVGMASMAAAGAVAGLGIAGLYRLLQQGIDPEKLLELAIEDMQKDLINLRQATIKVIASQKRILQQYNQAQAEVDKWHHYAYLALSKGDENLAREAILRKKTHAETASALKAQLDPLTTQVDTLKRNLVVFESKVSEAKRYKDMLKTHAAAIKAQEQLQSTIGRMGTGNAMKLCERLEEKVLQMEARAQAAAELAANDLETQFAFVQPASDVDDELMAMKAQLTGVSPNQVSLPSFSQFNTQPSDSSSKLSVDKDLEELRRQMDQL